MAKYIFITGGVVSGLGKGITGSSLGVLLKNSGCKIFMQKFDPYLNVDPGTMSPIQHGEVYVTNDGAETDLDLGHYERFIDINLSKNSSISAGKIYKDVLEAERRGEYDGATVQVVPHVTNAIKNKVYSAATESQADIIITEIGGTVGDIESQPFIEAIREVRMEKGRDSVIFIHVALLPFLGVSTEYKTKPIQHSVKELLHSGIQPDIIVARTTGMIDENIITKLAMFCNIPKQNVIVALDEKSIYQVPQALEKQNLHKIVAEQFKIKLQNTDMNAWNLFVKKINESTKEIVIHLVGKYVELQDAYLSVMESLKFAGYKYGVKVKINWIRAQDLNEENYNEYLKNTVGILVPGGFGERGFLGKFLAAKYARENNIPYLGICLGMQVACIEFARNVLKIGDANSTEFVTNTKNPIIDIIEGKNRENIGGTLRLGAYKTTIKNNTLAEKLYNSDEIMERHRHRFEFNNNYREQFEKAGMIFSGIYEEKNLVEIIEIPKNKFFVASQYHPEFTSRPNKPNPLFDGFIKSILTT
ncbi:CTP synthase [Spiroplasma endosymbiont of Labia minor]|uniref:CTP synthase n=1 Tax=Spiroplasma endosymbiont of Labia minor TaxID=3066305 RepID=UPI0030D308C0